jgi:hypothetical protein
MSHNPRVSRDFREFFARGVDRESARLARIARRDDIGDARRACGKKFRDRARFYRAEATTRVRGDPRGWSQSGQLPPVVRAAAIAARGPTDRREMT